MKYDFDFSHMPDYVLIKTGEFSVVEDFYKLLKDLTASSTWGKGTPQIIDHRSLDLQKMTPNDMQMICSIVEFYAEKLGNGKCAFILNDHIALLSAECNRAKETGIRTEIGVFSSLAQAKKWVLGK